MAQTYIRQFSQIRKSDTYTDNTAPSLTNYETNPVNIEDDLNSLRSQVNNLLQDQSGNWYNDLNTPTALDTGTQRGVNNLNTDLHELERKRVLVNVSSLADVTVPSGQDYVVLTAAQIPSAIAPAGSPIAAVGLVTTVGYVAASVTLGSNSLAEVTGSTAIAPRNLVEIVDGVTRDQILSDNRVVYALFQTDLADGATITGSPGTPSVQLSFVRINAAGDDLVPVPVADIAGRTINYAIPYRKALEDLNEQDFLRGAILDNAGSSTVTRQIAYDNQGITPVELGNNAILDIGTGLYWKLRDVLDADLLTVTEGSTGGTTTVALGTDVDTFSSSAAVNDFVQGITVDSGGTDIELGVTTAGSINTIGSADLTVKGAGELYLNDGNQTGSTWTQVGIKLSDTTTEWNQFETNFGEVSILNALNQSYAKDRGNKVYKDITGSDINANTDVNFPTIDFTLGSGILQSFDVYLNGSLLRPGADALADYDYYQGSTDNDLKFEFKLKVGDVVCVIPYATN